MTDEKTKYCKYCGSLIDVDCIICPKCGKQVEQIKAELPNVVINNNNTNSNINYAGTAGAQSKPHCYRKGRNIHRQESMKYTV